MTNFKVGDRVRAKHPEFINEMSGVITDEDPRDGYVTVRWEGFRGYMSLEDGHDYGTDELELVEPDAVSPNHYRFPNGAEVRQISGYLTGFGSQALQYIARATRIDGQNKGDAVEDLLKARMFINFELERLGEK